MECSRVSKYYFGFRKKGGQPRQKKNCQNKHRPSLCQSEEKKLQIVYLLFYFLLIALYSNCFSSKFLFSFGLTEHMSAFILIIVLYWMSRLVSIRRKWLNFLYAFDFESILLLLCSPISVESFAKIPALRKRAVMIFYIEYLSVLSERFLFVAKLKVTSKVVLIYRNGFDNNSRYRPFNVCCVFRYFGAK